jgi:hypothetical protein
MKVLHTYIFTYEQFKDIKVLTDIIEQVKVTQRSGQDDREVWLTRGDWPNFHMITLYEVLEQGLREFYVHRPYHNAIRRGSGTIYKDVLLKATEEQKNMMLNDENYDKIFG